MLWSLNTVRTVMNNILSTFSQQSFVWVLKKGRKYISHELFLSHNLSCQMPLLLSIKASTSDGLDGIKHSPHWGGEVWMDSFNQLGQTI